MYSEVAPYNILQSDNIAHNIRRKHKMKHLFVFFGFSCLVTSVLCMEPDHVQKQINELQQNVKVKSLSISSLGPIQT